MEILQGGRLPELVDGWAATLAAHLPPSPPSAIELAFLAAGLFCAAAAWRAQAPWLRGLLGEWKVRRLLRRHGAEAMHDVLLPRPDGAGWTQVDHLVRLPDRILVLETKNLGGRLHGAERDACWTQAFGRRIFQIQNPLLQNALHLAAVRTAAGRDVRLHGMVLLVGRGWVDDRLPMGCHRLGSFARQLCLLQRRDRFGPTWESRVASAWARIQEAASTRLRDRLHHEAAIARAHGGRHRLAPGLGLALAAGALLGLFLAG
jgi:restriction system protein